MPDIFMVSLGLLFILLTSDRPEAPPTAQERRTRFYCLIGVFWLRAGNDRLDVVPVGRLDSELRRVLRGGAGLDTLDDHGRAVLPGPKARRHVHRSPRQLDGQLPRRNLLPEYEGQLLKLITFLLYISLYFKYYDNGLTSRGTV